MIDIDHKVLWHPYASVTQLPPLWQVVGAQGVEIELADGRKLIDGMSSWWCVMHGYNHPQMNQAISDQLDKFAHVMFGGFTHEPAIRLAEKLVQITPTGLDRVFFSDSGSVAVEVAMKMAVQYWQAERPGCSKTRFAALRRGYHGDTWAAMSVCDPDTGMHHLFKGALAKQFFAAQPTCRIDQPWKPSDAESLRTLLAENHDQIAALILEPIVQGTGGMHFYHPEYLRTAKALCEEFDVLLIADEIATGFGRTGKLFGCNWADITPDIMCLGKSLTGGYLTLAATVCTDRIAQGISSAQPGVFMHGPTFMANPLACSAALRSVDLLLEQDWQSRVEEVSKGLAEGLAPARELAGVKEVRVLGAIGVIELQQSVDMAVIQPMFVEQGVWVRPFGKLVYLMPPFVIEPDQLARLCQGTLAVVRDYLAAKPA